MRAAISLGGSEAREALVKLESLILSKRGEDAALNQVIQDSTDEENIVDIILKLHGGMAAEAVETKVLEKTEALPTDASEALAEKVQANEGSDAAVAADAGDPRLDPAETPAT